ncbi:MAG: hypothetical protein EOP38_07405 [Rubrivivax sp.]|nr:MAG: hypothetical protein EOP38_07405 [Rubrivivax sp.]
MTHEITRETDHEEAIGAHSGFRVRVVTRWDAASRLFKVQAWVRGSETEQEVDVDTQGRAFSLLQDAQDHGFKVAHDWIDIQAGG